MKRILISGLVIFGILFLALKVEAKYLRYRDGTRAMTGLKGQQIEEGRSLYRDLELSGVDLSASPDALAQYLKHFDLAALGIGLADNLDVALEGDLLSTITRDGTTLLQCNYALDGLIESIEDRPNRLMLRYATADSFDYDTTYVEGENPADYNFGKDTHTVGSGGTGLMKDIVMTDADGNILTGNSIQSGYGRGYVLFAEGSPLIPDYSGSMPYVTDYYEGGSFHANDPVVMKSFEYYPDGSLKGEVNYAWSAGQRAGYLQHGRYTYNSTRYDESGNVTETNYYNDPAPRAYEPTFTGTVKQDKLGNILLTVAQGWDDGGQPMPQCEGKTYLLTTRHSLEGGQPGSNAWDQQNLQHAIDGGAAEFTAAGIGNLVGQQISLQGHLLVNVPVVTASGEPTSMRYQGEPIDIFSAFSSVQIL
ncbi:MAG: hypothetical protein HQ547_03630 [Candidatus Omnitrophica bacterium]|nr:hypothetical protein [Candidatus Omnitrophota bacterium]